MSHPIPVSALDDRLGFVGTAGSGKTYGAGTAVERLLTQKSRVIIPDPLGVWWGLRLTIDGKTPSPFDVVIFGGPHGDLPINEHAGALIGETVAGMKESAIVDLSQLGTKAAERRFMLAFLTTLYRKATKEPVHLIFDEADLWAPQVIRDREQEPAKLLGMMETIVRRGRVSGFVPWLITQRPAVVNKDVLSQVDGLVAFKLTASQDRKALGDWIEGQADRDEGKRILAGLPEKQTGEAVVWIPARGVLSTAMFPPKATYDSSRTPKRGEKKTAAELKPLDVGALRERLATVEAEAKANDPKSLRAEIARLKSEIQKISVATTESNRPDPRAIEEAERRGYDRGCAHFAKKTGDRYEQIGEDAAKLVAAAETLVNKIGDAAEEMVLQREEFSHGAAPASPTRSASCTPLSPPPVKSALPKPAPRQAQDLGTVDDVSLTGPQRRLLQALAWWAFMGHHEPTRTQVAAIAGWKPKGSNLRKRLSELSSKGLVEYPRDGHVSLTAAGHEAAPTPDTSVTLIESIRAILTGPQLQVFNTLYDFRGDAMTRAAIAAHINWEASGSNLRKRLSELSSLDLVEYPAKGEVALQAWVLA